MVDLSAPARPPSSADQLAQGRLACCLRALYYVWVFLAFEK